VVWYHRHYLKLTPYSTMPEHDGTSHNFQSILNENTEQQKNITQNIITNTYPILANNISSCKSGWGCILRSIFIYHYWYSALGPVWEETRAQSGDWHGSGTLHPGQGLRGSLLLLFPTFQMFPLFTTRCLHVRHDVRDPSSGSGKGENVVR